MPKPVEFDHGNKQWDTYKAFHCRTNGDLVHFETGELILTQRKRWPHQRCIESNYGIVRLYAHDDHYALRSLFTPDGQRVRRSWLCADSYAFDTATRQLFTVSWGTNGGNPNAGMIPVHHVPYAKAYCSGSGRRWVSVSSVHFTKPVKLTKEQKQAIKEVKLVCDAQRRVGALPQNIWQSEGKARFYVGYRGANPAVPHVYGLSGTVDDLNPMERNMIAVHGFMTPTETITVNELEVR